MPRTSKSKNGCVTCRKKRLKCDEAKPSCVRCRSSRICCEGYKVRDLKWRVVDRTTLGSCLAAKYGDAARRFPPSKVPAEASFPLNPNADAARDQEGSSTLRLAFTTATHAFRDLAQTQNSHESARSQGDATNDQSDTAMERFETPDTSTASPPNDMIEQGLHSSSGDVAGDHTGAASIGIPPPLTQCLGEAPEPQPTLDEDASTTLNMSHDWSEPGFHFSLTSEKPLENFFQYPIGVFGDTAVTFASEGSDTSGRVQDPFFSEGHISGIQDHAMDEVFADKTDSETSLLVQPYFEASSPEILTLRFDKETCGILSLKDGPTENPWRTLIWPLSSDSRAVHHALFSMAAAHGSYDTPSLGLCSIEDRNLSIKELVAEIGSSRLVPALATCLVLAFAEGWEQPFNTFAQHLRGAKAMIRKFLRENDSKERLRGSTPEARTLRYLCNTFIYMDVISGLTSPDEDADPMNEELVSMVNTPTGGLMEVDPLLGCAASLFPMIGKVTNIVRRVRRTHHISLDMISRSSQLQEQLQQWRLPNAAVFECFEDPESHVRHAIQTADALRYAALLYLQQAIPEICSDPAEILARKVLVKLARVPPTSRATNCQIFPLLIASCEVQDEEDREWVKQRWLAMISRLRVRNVDCCWELVQDVWARRDAYETEKRNQSFRSRSSFITSAEGLCESTSGLTSSNVQSSRTGRSAVSDVNKNSSAASKTCEAPCGALDGCSHEAELTYTVGCKLHWLGAMLDRKWEVFVG